MTELFLSLSQWEGQALLWIQDVLRRDWLTPFVTFYTTLGNHALLWIALCAALLLHPKTRRAGAAGILALLCSLLLTNVLLKNIAQRIRPWHIFEALVPLVQEKDPNSFPSDVVVGVLVGCFCGWAAVRILKALEERFGGKQDLKGRAQ